MTAHSPNATTNTATLDPEGAAFADEFTLDMRLVESTVSIDQLLCATSDGCGSSCCSSACTTKAAEPFAFSVDGVRVRHPVRYPGQLDSRRAILGLAPSAGGPATRREPAVPAPRCRREPVPDEFAVLEGLLEAIEPVRRLPRNSLHTVDIAAPWACGYCGGPAPRDSAEVEFRRRVWRICLVCSDTSHTRSSTNLSSC
ncbi:FxLD family lanthipeptide [Streptomyces sp. SID3343]|uniref:FxLD family lanthipeptide n=1 Tax=Streptomyces sp. SID3343 TaxID=2690260 RepID=UPI00136FEDFC|nr:FxLD family lanthipeptide [Streptomyces sp. SID3343]MYV97265.1 FxLD family lantipeptide [Streptomyces sp. SID3343]